MSDLSTVHEILDFAIREEEAAAKFYANLAGRMDKPSMKTIFKSFAREEEGHKAKLVAIKQGKQFEPVAAKVADLKIGDYLVDVATDGELDYQKALTVAMKKEKAAFKLYTDLAEKVDAPKLKETLLDLAQEEAKHKLRFEIEYDEFVLTEN